MIWDDNFLKIAFHRFFYTETTFAFFSFCGKRTLFESSMDRKTESQHNFSICILIISISWALFGSKKFIILAISALVTGIDESVLVVFILSILGTSLALSIRIHCLAKKLLNSSTLFLLFKCIYVFLFSFVISLHLMVSSHVAPL